MKRKPKRKAVSGRELREQQIKDFIEGPAKERKQIEEIAAEYTRAHPPRLDVVARDTSGLVKMMSELQAKWRKKLN